MRHAITSFPLGTVIYVVNSRYRVIDIRYMLDLCLLLLLITCDRFISVRHWVDLGLTSGVAYVCM